ncbi:phosphoribosylformylglycinamidine synthase-like [Glossina fuscipes fuscipes]
MSLIGWVGSFDESTVKQIVDVPDVALLHNKSEWFECRWATLCIASSKAMMLSKLNDSVLGCWVALDDNAKPTDVYPMNPNGAAEGIAGLCSREGRHLAMMPHLERCHAMFKWPYISPGFEITKGVSPWQIMFNTAYRGIKHSKYLFFISLYCNKYFLYYF